MNMTMKEYDGMLAVACVVLAVVLNALQISFIADGLVMTSHQDYIMASLMAIVISSGLFYSVFAGHRLWLKDMPRYYAWALGCLAGLLVGAMAAYSLSNTAQVGSARWWLGLIIGLSIPSQTLVLCNLTNGMLELAGSGWWKRFNTFTIFSEPAMPKVAVVMTAPPASIEVASSTIDTREEPAIHEEVRAIPDVEPPSVITVTEKPVTQSIFDNGAVSISVYGDHINIRVGRQLTNRQWKTFHSELRRVPLISWYEAQKAKTPEGGADRTIVGVLRLPDLKGKKNRKKRRAARAQGMDVVIGRLKELAQEHSST